MKKRPPIQIQAAEVERLIDQAQQGLLDAAAQKRIVALLRTLLWLERTLLETRISLAKLKKVLFGKRTEKPMGKPQQPADVPADASGDAEDTSDLANDTKLPAVDAAAAGDGRPSDIDTGGKTRSGEQVCVGTDVQKATPRPGHGRLGAADYSGAERVFRPHEELKAGDRCGWCTRTTPVRGSCR